MDNKVDPWELLRQARASLWDSSPFDGRIIAKIDAALAERSNTSKPLPRDVLCPKCGTPKTNPYKCELCSEYWGP